MLEGGSSGEAEGSLGLFDERPRVERVEKVDVAGLRRRRRTEEEEEASGVRTQ